MRPHDVTQIHLNDLLINFSSLQISVTPLFSYCSCKEGTCSEIFEASICHQDLGCHSHTKDIQRYHHLIISLVKEIMNEFESSKYPANQSNLFLLQQIQKDYEKLSDSNKNAAFSTEPFPFLVLQAHGCTHLRQSRYRGTHRLRSGSKQLGVSMESKWNYFQMFNQLVSFNAFRWDR